MIVNKRLIILGQRNEKKEKGKHASKIEPNIVVAMVQGVSRIFRLKYRKSKSVRIAVTLENKKRISNQSQSVHMSIQCHAKMKKKKSAHASNDPTSKVNNFFLLPNRIFVLTHAYTSLCVCAKWFIILINSIYFNEI